MNVTLVPSAGNDYKSKKAVLAAYNADTDFIIQHFQLPAKPINKTQCDAEGFIVMLRYNGLRRVTSV